VTNTFKGNLIGKDRCFGIVVSRFNELVSARLLSGALDCLTRHSVDQDAIDICWVPGAFEIPHAARMMMDTGRYHAVICLGAVIRGDTPHFEYVAGQVARGVAQLSLTGRIPVIFGLVTAETLEQALERAGAKAGNRGWEAAIHALEMSDLVSQIGKKPS
jgi:6,7-dimethyl-8-ribityllumazine synthase